jgi:isopenicillin N synthase-like dioxygenase
MTTYRSNGPSSTVDPPRLPTIDLSLFDIGDPWRDHVAAQVDWAAGTFGLFQILGHGVDSALVDTLLELGAKYVALEEAVGGRGSRQNPLDDLPGFHDTVREYTTVMTGLGHRLMTTMARGLRLDDSFFVDRYSGNPLTSLRIRDYPVELPRQPRPNGEGRAERGLLTIVKLGDAEGQQVRLDGQWIEIPRVPGALLCYVGPVLEHLTDGRYVSNAHRSSQGNADGRPSLSFVFEPAPDAVLTSPAIVQARPPEAKSGRYAFAARC